MCVLFLISGTESNKTNHMNKTTNKQKRSIWICSICDCTANVEVVRNVSLVCSDSRDKNKLSCNCYIYKLKLDQLVPHHFLCYFTILITFISPVKMKTKRSNFFIYGQWFKIPEDQKTFFQDSGSKCVSKPFFLIRQDLLHQ